MFSKHVHELRKNQCAQDKREEDSRGNKEKRVLRVYGQPEQQLAENARRRAASRTVGYNATQEDSKSGLKKDASILLGNPSTIPRAYYKGGGELDVAKSVKCRKIHTQVSERRMDRPPGKLEAKPFSGKPHQFRDRNPEKEIGGVFLVPVAHSYVDMITRSPAHDTVVEHTWAFADGGRQFYQAPPFGLAGGKDFFRFSKPDLHRPNTAELDLFRNKYKPPIKQVMKERNQALEKGTFSSTFPQDNWPWAQPDERPKTAPCFACK